MGVPKEVMNMSKTSSRQRAARYRKTKTGELTIFLVEMLVLALLAGITYFMGLMNIQGFNAFGLPGIVAGLLVASAGGAIYTANNRHQMLHVMAALMIVLYVLGLALEYVYRVGAWFVNVVQTGTLGWFAGFLIGLFIFFNLVLAVTDAHAQNMR